MPKWLLPWLLPLGMVVGVVVAAVATPLIGAALFALLVFFGVPFAYTVYRKTSAQEREEGRPGGPSWLA
jgi:hypothetical protein